MPARQFADGLSWDSLSSTVQLVFERNMWTWMLAAALILTTIVTGILVDMAKRHWAKQYGDSPSPEGGGAEGRSRRGSGAGLFGAGMLSNYMLNFGALKGLKTWARVSWGQVSHTDAERSAAAGNLPRSDQLAGDPKMADPAEFVKRYG